MRTLSSCLAALLITTASASARAAGDAERGRELYPTRCGACHSLDHNGVGPAHRGAFGRAAGQAKGYAYSEALKYSKLVWGDETLDRWLTDPEQAVPGQRMGVSVPEAQDRADLIAYLKLYAGPPRE